MSFTANIDDVVEQNRNGLLGKHSTWGRIRLKEVASILNGFPFESRRFSKDRGVPLIRIRDIVPGRTETFYDGEYDPTFIVVPGDILVGMDGDFNCESWKGEPALLNQRVCKITPNELRYSKDFLRLVLPGYLSAINQQTPSVTVKHLSSRTVAEIPLPFPSIPEQRRIVADIEKQFTRLDSGVTALRHSQANLRRYRAAILQAACEGRLVVTEAVLAKGGNQPLMFETGDELLGRILNERREGTHRRGKYEEPGPPLTADLPPLPEAWTWATIEQLLRSDAGLSYGILKPGREDPNGVPMVRVMDIGEGKLTGTEIMRVDPKLSNEFRRTVLESGDILLAVMATVGRCTVVPEQLVGANVNRALAVIKPTRSVLSKFLELAIRSPRLQYLFQKNKIGSAQARINLTDLRTYCLPLPPVAEQVRIVEEAERQLSVTDTIETATSEAILRAERLRKSILQKAFNGGLIPQIPDGEVIQAPPIRMPPSDSRTADISPRIPSAKSSPTTMSTKSRSIISVLSTVAHVVTPEELFTLCGRDSSRIEDVEDFFEELRGLCASGQVEELRKDKASVSLRARA